MCKPLIILHGWSDHAQTFYPLAEQLEHTLGRPSQGICIADYLTLDDSVDYDDLADAMQTAWLAHDLPQTPQSVDIIVHSTGGLVFRHWLTHYYPAGESPIDHVLMLAPANFGSPLAIKGEGLLGRVLRGLGHHKPFEVGELLLQGLELSSPYSWHLAERDLFSEVQYYGLHGILCTIFVGDQGLTGLDAIANEPGTDGTVRLASTNLDVVRLSIDCKNPNAPSVRKTKANATIAFAVLQGENHHTITGVQRSLSHLHFDWMCRALTVKRDDFPAWQSACRKITANAQQITTCGYQNIISRVQDQHEKSVKAYDFEWTDAQGQALTRAIMSDHTINHQDSSYHNCLLNVHYLKIHQQDIAPLSIRFKPQLDIDRRHCSVGFAALDGIHHRPLIIQDADIAQWLQPNRTLMIDWTMHRSQNIDVFQLQGDRAMAR